MHAQDVRGPIINYTLSPEHLAPPDMLTEPLHLKAWKMMVGWYFIIQTLVIKIIFKYSIYFCSALWVLCSWFISRKKRVEIRPISWKWLLPADLKIQCLLCARCKKPLWGLLIFWFYRWANWDIKKLGNFSMVILNLDLWFESRVLYCIFDRCVCVFIEVRCSVKCTNLTCTAACIFNHHPNEGIEHFQPPEGCLMPPPSWNLGFKSVIILRNCCLLFTFKKVCQCFSYFSCKAFLHKSYVLF